MIFLLISSLLFFGVGIHAAASACKMALEGVGSPLLFMGISVIAMVCAAGLLLQYYSGMGLPFPWQ